MTASITNREDKAPESLFSTGTLCPTCLKKVNGVIEIAEGNIRVTRDCSEHGQISTLLFDDVKYFQTIERAIQCARGVECYSTVILELLDACNLRCSTCSAASSPELSSARSYESLINNINDISKLPMPPTTLMLSGGEPSIHPRILDIVAFANKSAFKHIFLITNGLRLSENEEFAKSLSSFNKLEVYLQFDALDSDALLDIRGVDLRDTRLHAVKHLQKYNIPTSLVCVLKKDINDFMIGEILDYALSYQNVRGVTFQPIRFLGRVDGSDPVKHSLSISEVRRKIAHHFEGAGLEMQPHPLSPGTIAIGYLHRFKKVDVTQKVVDALQAELAHNVPSSGGILFPYPHFQLDDFFYDDIFRVAIVAYQDRYTYTEYLSNYSTISFWSKNNTRVPIERYYLEQSK